MGNKYSVTEMIKTAYSLMLTKLTIPKARLIRRPIYVRGAHSLYGCTGLTTGRFCRFDLEGCRKTLFIGEDCEFGDMTHIVAHECVEIGSNVLIASKCFISDTNHGNYKDNIQSRPDMPPGKRTLVKRMVKIGSNVWIGENAVILPGSIIGDGCIIGANSVVNTKIPDNCIVAGAPATVKKRWNHVTSKWE